MADACAEEEEETYKNESSVLLLTADADGAEVMTATFNRGEAPNEAAAALLGLPAGERVRCFHCPMFEKALGWSVHLYVDLQGIEHKLDHNTLATQLWLVANLPGEPPEVAPDSIHGPVLLTAEDCKTNELMDVTLEHWAKLVDVCKQVQPNATFTASKP